MRVLDDPRSQGQRYGKVIDYKVSAREPGRTASRTAVAACLLAPHTPLAAEEELAQVSELRAVELLENLCGSLNNKWTLVTVPSGGGGAADGKTRKTVHWERTVEAAPGSRPGTQEEEVRQKQLTSFCGR